MYLKELPPLKAVKTATKVKIFVRHSLDDVENDVNDWIGQRDIRITHVTQSQCEKQGKFVFVISVFYEAAG
jgi:hypothetical protein